MPWCWRRPVVTAALVVLGAVFVLAVAAPIYAGVPTVEAPWQVLTGFGAGMVTMITLGIALGLAAPTARAAQALGLLVFMPMWLLSVVAGRRGRS